MMFRLSLIFACLALWGSERPFVSAKLCGQLGNQFFQIATAYALAWDHGVDVCFTDWDYAPGWKTNRHHFFFRCNDQALGRVEHEVSLPGFGYYPIDFRPNMMLQGFYQNEKYFVHHRARLLELFAPHEKDLKIVRKKFGWILDHPESVSVHVRYYRGETQAACFIQYDRNYFEKAMALFPKSSLFVVTSDCIEFAKKHIPTEGRNVVFIQSAPYYQAFLIQRYCKHQIISNSTFSWWSAWLNENLNKIVVRPKVWLGGFPDIGGPDEWIKVE
jgi:hypothetical protein